VERVLGVDLGGTNLRWGFVDRDGGLTGAGSLTHRAAGSVLTPAELIEHLAAVVEDSPETVRAVGLAAPGPLDLTRGAVVGAVNLPSWRDVPLVQPLEERFGLPVRLINDGTAFTLGEARYGAAAGAENVLGLTLGTGVGGGALQDGRPLLGRRGNALEIGHLTLDPWGPLCNCGRRGCLEVYASASAVARRGRELTGEADLDAATIVERAARGDEPCRGVLAEAGRRLGRGIALSLTLIDADLVVIGGGLSRAGGLILDPARAALGDQLFPERPELRLVASNLDDAAAVLGAAAWAWDSIA